MKALHLSRFVCRSFPKGEILNDTTTIFGNRVCSLIDGSSFGWPFWKLWKKLWSRNFKLFYLYLSGLLFCDLTLIRIMQDAQDQEEICSAHKPMPVVTDNDDSDSDTVDTVDNCGTARV